MNKCFASRHFFLNLSLRKPFLVQNYNLGSFSFRQTGFFAHVLTLKNYKNIEEIAKYSLTKACTEYCSAKHI